MWINKFLWWSSAAPHAAYFREEFVLRSREHFCEDNCDDEMLHKNSEHTIFCGEGIKIQANHA